MPVPRPKWEQLAIKRPLPSIRVVSMFTKIDFSATATEKKRLDTLPAPPARLSGNQHGMIANPGKLLRKCAFRPIGTLDRCLREQHAKSLACCGVCRRHIVKIPSLANPATHGRRTSVNFSRSNRAELKARQRAPISPAFSKGNSRNAVAMESTSSGSAVAPRFSSSIIFRASP